MLNPNLSIPALLGDNAVRFDCGRAIASDGNEALSHRGLWDEVIRTVEQLNILGIGRGDRVAIVLPQGPELAVAFLAITCGASAAPLNPAYLEKEFTFYLEDLRARALIVMAGDDTPARAAAESLGVPIIELVLRANGNFDLSGTPRATASPTGFAEAEDLALILHTSGTTSRPKIVPLTHANLCASARHIGKTLELVEADTCLNVMPLFHIHGLVACVLASLAAGGSTICTRAFDASQFTDLLEAWRPTWYSAVPTMHQAILAHLQQLTQSPVASSLRFIRSSSAALPPTVMAGLENTFRVPVLESYGMTEAAHQMTSNPLPPRARKAGCVGLPAGPEVAILDEAGMLLKPGTTGEIVIRGPNVTLGYEGNPEANATAFHHGWLRTGDQGYLDPDGYLFITGRLKELINRGGEKIAPREIDEALLAHPAVRQAVAFAVPHPTLGEDIAAAVVFMDRMTCGEAELRDFAMNLLPPFKVPSRIVSVSDIPKGPTGKIQRIGLATKLASALAVAYEAPQTAMEARVIATILEVLGDRPIGRNDNFFAHGGDSLRATRVLTRLRQALNLDLPVILLFRFPTPLLIAAKLEEMQATEEVDALAEALTSLGHEELERLLEETSLT